MKQLTQPDLLLELGNKIRDARKEKGMLLEELATKSGIHMANLSKIERGLINVSVSSLEKLALSLDMKLEINFKDKKQKTKSSKGKLL